LAACRDLLLVVEDEILPQYCSRLLRMAVYKVGEAANAAEAIAIFVTGT
jgi:hypothetical protein